MPQALQIGPLVLPWGPAVVLLGYAVAALLAWAERRAGRGDAEPALYAALLAALVVARAVFVVQHRDDYHGVLAMLDLRDLGFAPWPGIVTGAALLALWWWRRPQLRRALLSSAIGGLLAALLLLGALQLTQPQRTPLPDLTLRTLAGQPVALHGLLGQPLVLNLWATWCPPCRRELPLLVAAARHAPDVRIVLVDQGEDAARVQAYLRAQHLQPPLVLLDPHSSLLRSYHSPGLPTTLFIAADGRLEAVHVGELSAATLAQHLARLRRAAAARLPAPAASR